MELYEWIDIEEPQDYESLVQIVDPEFDPAGIAQRLGSGFTDAVQGVLVEHGYVDKDYRSTFYNFYAKKGRPYRSDCIRLHFFDGSVRFDEARTDVTCVDCKLHRHYFGYIVLRPTIVATLGRSVISPCIRIGARGRAIQSVHHVSLLGHRLPVSGFPSMAQHVDIAVCAHVSCWAVLRHYSQTFSQHREYLLHDITKLTGPFDPGGLVPSLGFSVQEAERVFQAAGCFPVLVGKSDAPSDEAFFYELLAYVESGFPLFIAMPGEEHAVVVVGHSWRQSVSTAPAASSSHVWNQVGTLLAVDDNLLPYSTVPLRRTDTPRRRQFYTADSIDSFIVALPDKIYYPADAIDGLSLRVERWLARSSASGREPLELRRYFITTVSRLREHARQNQGRWGEELVALVMNMETAQFVWVLEFCSVSQWHLGVVAGRAIVDATASPHDPSPMWLLHNEDVAFVFDRSGADLQMNAVRLDRTGIGPLPRIELNLRPVADSPASTTSSAGTDQPGGDA